MGPRRHGLSWRATERPKSLAVEMAWGVAGFIEILLRRKHHGMWFINGRESIRLAGATWDPA